MKSHYSAVVTGLGGSHRGTINADTLRDLESRLRGLSMYGQISRDRRGGIHEYTIYGLVGETAGYADITRREALTPAGPPSDCR